MLFWEISFTSQTLNNQCPCTANIIDSALFLELLLKLMEKAYDELKTDDDQSDETMPILEGKAQREYQKIKTKSQ